MAFNRQFNGNNYGGGNNYQRNNFNGGNQQQFQQQAKPPVNLEEEIDKRLDLFAMILQKAQEKGIDRDTFLMANGLTAWVTSLLIDMKGR